MRALKNEIEDMLGQKNISKSQLDRCITLVTESKAAYRKALAYRQQMTVRVETTEQERKRLARKFQQLKEKLRHIRYVHKVHTVMNLYWYHV